MNENVTVCITPKGDKPVLHFSQFDNERIFTVTVLADDGESAAVLTGLDIEFRLRKTDSHVVTIAPESVADNVITFKTTEQMCACCGQNIASVVLMDSEMIVSTLDILVDIQRDILSGGLTSESDIRNLTTQIEQIVPEVVGDDYYNKQEVDALLAEHTFDPSNYYDKSETDDLLSAKMNTIGYHGIVDDAAVISFTTDCKAPLDIIKGKITPVQDLHGYSKPWIGGGGKNKINVADKTQQSSGYLFTNYAIVLPSGNWTLSFDSTASSGQFNLIIKNGSTDIANKIGNLTNGRVSLSVTTTQSSTLIKCYSNTGGTFSKFMLENNSTATAYEPYSNICPISGFSALNVTLADGDMQTVDTATVNFGQTVYGGSLDVTNGKLTITHAYIKGGFEEYKANNGYKAYKKSGLSLSIDVSTGGISNVISDFGTFDSNNMTKNIIQLPNSGVFYMALDENFNPDDVELVYPLATPIEIDTTPVTVSSIAGVNNIFIDTGNLTEIAYFEGVEDNLIKLIKACQI